MEQETKAAAPSASRKGQTATVFRVATEFIDRDGTYYPFGAEYTTKDKAREKYLAELGYIEPWVNADEPGQT